MTAATRLLGDHRDALDRVIGFLLVRETIASGEPAFPGLGSR